MSRIGKKPIDIPDGVKVLLDGARISIEGPKGKLSREIVQGITVDQEEGRLLVKRPDNQRQSRANQGLIRALIANMVEGVNKGFEKMLDIRGVGYRAEHTGNQVVLTLGYSHEVKLDVPESLDVTIEKGTRVIIRGIDRQLVGQMAAKVRASRIPDPYKVKGVTYVGERIVKKAGKKAIS